MSATGIQNPSGSAHTGTPWSWVGVSAVLVLMLAVLTIWLARDTGETTTPPTVRTETTAPVTDVGLPLPTKGVIVRGGGYVVMPPRATAGGKSEEDLSTVTSGFRCPAALWRDC
jgi:hypothetical protein